MLKKGDKVIVKVGTSTLTYDTGMLNISKIEKLCKVLADIHNRGIKVILVSSGAVSAGKSKVNFGNDNTIELKQAAAAVGQSELMNMYSRNFTPYGHTVAQILLTKDAIDNKERFDHAKKTFELLLDNGVIPVVNENDSVSCEGIKFGGNDILSAYVAIITKADLVINLTDVDGLFDSDPRKYQNAKLITTVSNYNEVEKLCSGAGTKRGTGGMQAKLISARMAGEAGVPTFVANGENPEILYDIINGNAKGTYFVPLKD